ncbi:hypothetical protein [Variovorax sp. KK3]|uniref:hypothetical protein n=1 Tax=Variovorax sp. KK3 TaxID=1855728 RepID=UPI00117C5F1B|nr:hypothetical protein [Variovorax sp. KK3]
MNNKLRVSMVEMVSDADPNVRWQSNWIEVTGPGEVAQVPGGRKCVPRFQMMCEEIRSDIQTVEGSGASTLKALHLVESGLSAAEKLGGNAWYTFISLDEVRFEGLYDQGDGGEVTFSQYKLAVETYIRFLTDPDRNPVEVVFLDL